MKQMKVENFCAGGWGYVKVDDPITSTIDGGSVVAFVGAPSNFTIIVGTLCQTVAYNILSYHCPGSPDIVSSILIVVHYAYVKSTMKCSNDNPIATANTSITVYNVWAKSMFK